MRKNNIICLLAALLTCSGCVHFDMSKSPKSSFKTTSSSKLPQGDFRDIVSQAKDSVFPAVVYIKCLREDFSSGRKQTQAVSGSGVLITESGRIVTNWHVVDKAIEVRCQLNDGTEAYATVIGSDKDCDIALLELKNIKKELPYAKLGDSKALREGDFVMAMGAPFGLSRSVSIGIISCTDRYLEEGLYSLWLQTDAAICPGNSGGPLVNTAGEIVGINTLGSNSGGGDLGFAVPSETVKLLVERLGEFGKANWSWTGLQLQALRDFDSNIYFEGDSGVIVSGTDPASPARTAGFLPQDRIISIDNMPVKVMRPVDLPALRRHIGLLAKNTPVKCSVKRGNELLELELTPVEKGVVEGQELDCPRWDLTLKMINRFDNPDLYFHCKEGVFVNSVKEPGNARKAGLQRNDIITKIGDRQVLTLDDISEIHKQSIADLEQNKRLVLSVLRNGTIRQVVLDIARDYER